MTNNKMQRMPRQAPGIIRGSSGPAALRGVSGVEAAGILEWLLGDDLGGEAGDLVDKYVPGGGLFHKLGDIIYDAVS